MDFFFPALKYIYKLPIPAEGLVVGVGERVQVYMVLWIFWGGQLWGFWEYVCFWLVGWVRRKKGGGECPYSVLGPNAPIAFI